MTIHLPSETALALAMALTDARYDLHAKRVAAEAAIEDLINFLDDTDGDCDLEPSLGCNGYMFDLGADAVDLEGGDVQDEPHDEIDEDGRDVSWPEGGPSRMHPGWQTEDDEDGHDAEQTNEDGGNVIDEPHDALDEGNDEYSLDGVEPDGPVGTWGMSWDEVQKCKGEARTLLARVPHRSQVRPEQWITGPDGRQYRFVS